MLISRFYKLNNICNWRRVRESGKVVCLFLYPSLWSLPSFAIEAEWPNSLRHRRRSPQPTIIYFQQHFLRTFTTNQEICVAIEEVLAHYHQCQATLVEINWITSTSRRNPFWMAVPLCLYSDSAWCKWEIDLHSICTPHFPLNSSWNTIYRCKYCCVYLNWELPLFRVDISIDASLCNCCWAAR